jgi:hypothetical protein
MSVDAEPITSWMIWTQAVIPALGVLASTAVAIVALWLASKDRRADHAEAVRSRRAEIAVLLRAWAREFQAESGIFGTRGLDEARRVAAKADRSDRLVITWLEAEARGPESWETGQGGRFLRRNFEAKVLERLDMWERTGVLDRRPLAYDDDSPAPGS